MIEVLSFVVSTYLYSAIDCVFYNVTCELTVHLDSRMSRHSFLETDTISES